MKKGKIYSVILKSFAANLNKRKRLSYFKKKKKKRVNHMKLTLVYKVIIFKNFAIDTWQ